MRTTTLCALFEATFQKPRACSKMRKKASPTPRIVHVPSPSGLRLGFQACIPNTGTELEMILRRATRKAVSVATLTEHSQNQTTHSARPGGLCKVQDRPRSINHSVQRCLLKVTAENPPSEALEDTIRAAICVPKTGHALSVANGWGAFVTEGRDTHGNPRNI